MTARPLHWRFWAFAQRREQFTELHRVNSVMLACWPGARMMGEAA